jgi:hypothetical protein
MRRSQGDGGHGNDRPRLFALTRIQDVVLVFGGEGGDMDSNYVFLCGVMWCGYGQQEAGKEPLRATRSADPDIRALAWAMLAKGMSELKKKALDHPGKKHLEDSHVDKTMRVM